MRRYRICGILYGFLWCCICAPESAIVAFRCTKVCGDLWVGKGDTVDDQLCYPLAFRDCVRGVACVLKDDFDWSSVVGVDDSAESYNVLRS